MSSSSRGKWSVVGSIISAPVRGFYYPGRVKTVKKPIEANSAPLYSVAFSNPLDSLEETHEHALILDFSADQLIGRGFEPITRALLSKNQKVFITHRGREVSARVVEHNTERDEVNLLLDTDQQDMLVKLHEVRLLPSRKSGRLQEHPDYSLLASGRRSPDTATEISMSKPKTTGGRRRTVSSSASLLASENSGPRQQPPTSTSPIPQVSAYIDVPMQTGRKRRPSNPDVMDECAAALVLMSLSASPRSPTLLTERKHWWCEQGNNTDRTTGTEPSKLFRCTWPGCTYETFACSAIEKHVRHDHRLDKENGDEEIMSGDEDFYYTEVDLFESIDMLKRNGQLGGNSVSNSYTHSSSGPESPVSLSEDAASSSSSGTGMMVHGDNSMDSSPPSSPSATHHGPNYHNHQFFKSAFVPVSQPRHLEDHVYNRRPDPAGISILGSGTAANRRGRKGFANASTPINIPNNGGGGESMPASSSFGGFSGASSLSSGFGSYSSYSGSSFSPVSPPRNHHSHHHHHHHHTGSLSSSLSSGSNKYYRTGATARNGSGTTLLQAGAGGPNRTSPTKRGRGETRKCRKVYGMEKKDSWCTQCKWKKACTRFTD